MPEITTLKEQVEFMKHIELICILNGLNAEFQPDFDTAVYLMFVRCN